jgi:CheY-like chemotaxis protein
MNHTPFKTVMVIDDNQVDLYVASKLISKNNFADRLLTYTSAIDALHYLKEHENEPDALPQVLFVDIYMPLMSGFEFMDEFDKLPSKLKKDRSVFIVSSTIDEDDIDRTRRDPNITAFCEKPMTGSFLEQVAGKNGHPNRA